MSLSNWLACIQNKLRENEDYYPTKSIKLVYIKGLIRGEAAKRISLRLRHNAIDPYTTIQDLYDHLTTLFENPNRMFIAKNEFKKLYIKTADSFYEFHTKFLLLANKAKVALAKLKYKLNSKLSFNL